MRPLGEADLGDEPRLDPDDVALPHLRHLRHLRERRLVGAERLQPVEQPLDLGVVEARADVARPPEPAVLVDRQHERAEGARTPALPHRVADDDELLPALRLHLEPVAAAPSRLVAGVGALADDPLEPLRRRRLEERGAVVERLREPDGAVALVEQRLQPLVPLGQRQVDDRLALDLEDVEEIEHERPRSLLHRREAGAPLVVERADLAVEHAVRRLHRLHDRAGNRLEAGGQRVAVAARQFDFTARDRHDRAVAVPLHLVQPLLAGRHRLGERGQHRLVGARLARRGRVRRLLLHEQPVLRIASELRRDERPLAVQPLAVQAHGHAAVRLLLDELVRPPVPDLDRAGAVVARRDLALERRVGERVILDVDGKVLRAGLQGDALGDSPAEENAVALEPEVVVEPAGVVALDDEDRRLAALALPERLGRLRA